MAEACDGKASIAGAGTGVVGLINQLAWPGNVWLAGDWHGAEGLAKAWFGLRRHGLAGFGMAGDGLARTGLAGRGEVLLQPWLPTSSSVNVLASRSVQAALSALRPST